MSSPPGAPDERTELVLHPIGVVRTPFSEKMQAPRQPPPEGAEGRIELFAGHNFEHALQDMSAWDRIWVLFWFHLNEGWRPKVLPPRSGGVRRGLFSTRSPHRPNPIGMSALELLEVRPEERVLRVRGVDMLDKTPVLDIKPYVPWADAYPGASNGWLEVPDEGTQPPKGSRAADPMPEFSVRWTDGAREQVEWLRAEHRIDLIAPVERVLSLGPQPHPYRRIRRDGDRFRLAVKDWRVGFRVEGREVWIDAVTSGYRRSELDADPAPATLEVHRAFVTRFPSSR